MSRLQKTASVVKKNGPNKNPDALTKENIQRQLKNFNFEKSINSLRFNTGVKLANVFLPKQERKRLKQQKKDLEKIHEFFTKNKDYQCKAIVGLAEGCFKTDKAFAKRLKGENFSDVEGVVYKDNEGKTHYFRLGSSNNLFSQLGKPKDHKNKNLLDSVFFEAGKPKGHKNKDSEHKADTVRALIASGVDVNIATKTVIDSYGLKLSSDQVLYKTSLPTKEDIKQTLNEQSKRFAKRLQEVYKSLDESESYYGVKEEKGKDHSHFKVIKMDRLQKALEIVMKENQEGCPCCVTGIDFDELAAAISETTHSLQNDHGDIDLSAVEETATVAENGFAELPDFSSASHWGVAGGILLPFAVIGISAAVQNIMGSTNTLKSLKKVMKALDKQIKEAEKAAEENRKNQELDKAKACSDKVTRLKAFKSTLDYSKFDSIFNLAVPGVTNGVASLLVLSTMVGSSPLAPAVLGVYGLAQSVRNFYDLGRTWDHKISPERIQEKNNENINAGMRKVNQIGNSRRNFYAVNGSGFLLFFAGALLTAISVPALAVGVGGATLPIGIALLTAGAVSTGITNNVWNKKYARPRNGDLGVPRSELSQERCLEELGMRKRMKTALKEQEKKLTYKKNKAERFGLGVLSAMPGAAAKAQSLRHESNKRLFLLNREAIEQSRVGLLEELLEIKLGSKSQLNNDISSSWDAIKRLGFEQDVMNVLLDEFPIETSSYNHGSVAACCEHSHDHHHHESKDHACSVQGACTASHSKDDTIKKMLATGLFEKVSLNDVKSKPKPKLTPGVGRILSRGKKSHGFGRVGGCCGHGDEFSGVCGVAAPLRSLHVSSFSSAALESKTGPQYGKQTHHHCSDHSHAESEHGGGHKHHHHACGDHGHDTERAGACSDVNDEFMIKGQSDSELNLNKTQKKALKNAIDFFLTVQLKKKLAFQQYGLNDYYWALDKESKKANQTINSETEAVQANQTQSQTNDLTESEMAI